MKSVFTPTFASHSRTVLVVHSGPLSDRMCAGTPALPSARTGVRVPARTPTPTRRSASSTCPRRHARSTRTAAPPAPARERGTRDARSHPRPPEHGSRHTPVCPGSEDSRGRFLQDRLVQLRVSEQPLQPGVRLLEILETLRLDRS